MCDDRCLLLVIGSRVVLMLSMTSIKLVRPGRGQAEEVDSGGQAEGISARQGRQGLFVVCLRCGGCHTRIIRVVLAGFLSPNELALWVRAHRS